MSGVFDALGSRFAPAAKPAITPRARGRFEGGPPETGLEEVMEERVALRPAPPTPSPLSRRKDKPQSNLEATRPATAATPPTAAPVRPKSSEPPIVEERAAPVPTREPQPTEATPRTPHTPTPETPPPVAIESRDGLPERIIETRLDREHRRTERIEARHTERIVEINATPARPPAKPVSTKPTRHRREDVTESVPAAPSVTVKIGKIEVSAPPPEPLPRPRAPAPQATRTARSGRAPSGLTDYLGWKK